VNGLSNYLRVSRNILASLEEEEFWTRYPTLARIQRSTDASSSPDVGAIFRAIRDDLPAAADFIDRFLILAARLDLQQAEIRQDYSYLDETLPQGQAVRTAISEGMNLPFRKANYLCHLSNRHKYLYVATPKVACTVIKHSLQQAEMDGTLVFRQYGDEHFPTLSPLLAPLDDPKLYFAALKTDDWFRFTFVRNPFSRVLSCYLDKIVNSVLERNRLLPEIGIDPAAGIPSFSDFLKGIAGQTEDQCDIHWAPQSWLTQPQTMHYHFIGRLERFDTDFQQVCQVLGIAPETGAARHSTDAAQKLAAFYGGEEIELVRMIYARDFTDFGYDSQHLTTQ